MGRPPIAPEMRRTERVTINVTREEREQLEQRAQGKSLSDFVREIVLRFLGRHTGR